MAGPNDPIRIDSRDLFSSEVEEYLSVQENLKQNLAESEPQPLWARLLFSNWFYLSLASGLGAFLAWASMEPFFSDNDDDGSRYVGIFLFPAVAGGVGLFLGAAEGVMCRNPMRALISAVVGTLVGFLGALVLIIPVGIFYNVAMGFAVTLGGGVVDGRLKPGLPFLVGMIARAVAWAVVSIPAGIGQGIALREWKVTLNGLLGSALGGLLGGLLFDPIYHVFSPADGEAAASRAMGLTIIGLMVGLFVGLIEGWTKTAWLLMKQGPLAGKQFIMHRETTVLGSSPKAEIYLFKDPAIEPRHAIIHNRGGRYEIEDCDTPDGTFVNGQLIDRHRLQTGDQITLGKTVLEFAVKDAE
ncbi:MAG: FHA domain-containing protein [Planctomycetota bacterium]|nr:FHA domain-containing protein [Planctomycetota bacterium]